MKGVASVRSQSDSTSVQDLAELLDNVHRGDAGALSALYDATVGKLYGLASAILRSVDDAEDVVCETYAYVWSNPARYDRGRGNVLAWLLMLCRSRALDRLRRRRAHAATLDQMQHAQDAETIDGPDDLLSLLQQHTTIYAALANLTPERRRLISLAFLHGMSHQQIAERTGLPLGTVKSHVRRALTQLRDFLGDA